jgi:hypothetical protein
MMKLRMELTLTLVLVLGCLGEAQDGGKIPWRGKGASDDVKAIMAEASKEGKAIMLFFTSEG